MDISDFLSDFRLELPDMKGRTAHAISVHIGWLNWGDVGDVSFDELVEHLKAQKIGEFERPGDYYNFVSYRDRSRTYMDKEGVRRTEFPNSRIYYVRRKEPLNDIILTHLLEPTQFGEIWVDRVVALLKRLNVARYQVIGAMGSPVPHTRPIKVTGRSSAPDVTDKLRDIGITGTAGSQYEGPTSIFNTLSTKLSNEGITTVSIIAHLPTYFSLQEADHNGVFSVLDVISRIEGIEIPLGRYKSSGKRQYDAVAKDLHMSESLAALLKDLENLYDQESEKTPEGTIQLPPNIQKAIDEAFGKD